MLPWYNNTGLVSVSFPSNGSSVCYLGIMKSSLYKILLIETAWHRNLKKKEFYFLFIYLFIFIPFKWVNVYSTALVFNGAL